MTMIQKQYAYTIITVSFFMAVLLYCGCAAPKGILFPPLSAPLLWPEPPEKPRIQYIGSLSTQLDLKKETQWTQGFEELIAGKKHVGVLLSPYAVAVDNNVLYVTDVSAGVVHVMNLQTRDYSQFTKISETQNLNKPVGLAIINNHIYVVDAALKQVYVFNKEGLFLFSFGRDQLKRPTGIAFTPGGNRVYVTDTARHTIAIFTTEGKYLEEIGKRGAKSGQFNFPTQICTDHSGKLYVSDTLNYRVQIFTKEGKFLKEFGTQGDRPGNFAHPCGIATDSFGNIYVTDRQFENIQIFNNKEQILMAWGHEGSGPGEFWLPAGIAIDDHNRIYVADSFNKRIQVFEFLGDSEI